MQKVMIDLLDIFISGRSRPSVKVILFWRWSSLTFTVT